VGIDQNILVLNYTLNTASVSQQSTLSAQFTTNYKIRPGYS